jgi:hypothetical protein
MKSMQRSSELVYHPMLEKYRRIMDRIHENGNIFYDPGRMKACVLIAAIASILRRQKENVEETGNQ